MTTTEHMQLDAKAADMMSLFEGFAEAYGTYDAAVANEEKGGKLEIRSTAQTKRGNVTLELWRQHLLGKRPLGIIPIRDNQTCFWGVIDVDKYGSGINHASIEEKISKLTLPLVVCRSKSGGAHIFLFMKTPVPAKDMQDKLRELAVLLGVGGSEIFPKQTTVFYERGDFGSWLNMPYFGGDDTDRYGIKAGGLAMSLAQFIALAKSKRQPLEFMKRAHRQKLDKDPEFGDGPPCLQHLAATTFPPGTRNKGLFNLMTFAKKKYGSDAIDHIDKWNRDYFDPPLPSSEVAEIIKQQEKKDYHYTCKDTPLSNHCNSVLCKSRRFGVGGEDEFPQISGISVLESDPPVWFVDVNGIRMELATEELQDYKKFHRVCMERLYIVFKQMRADTWLQIVGQAMKDLTKIEASVESSHSGQFYEILEEFLTNRHAGQIRDHLLMGRPWEDQDVGRHYFRLQDLHKFVEGQGFKVYRRGQMVARIKAMGGDKHFFNIGGRGVHVYWVPNVFKPMPDAPLPPLPKKPI